MHREFSLKEAFTYMWEEEGARKKFLTIVGLTYLLFLVMIVCSVAMTVFGATVDGSFGERVSNLQHAPMRPGDRFDYDMPMRTYDNQDFSREMQGLVAGSIVGLGILSVTGIFNFIVTILASGYVIELMRNIVWSREKYVPAFDDLWGKFRVGFKSIIPGIVLFIVAAALSALKFGVLTLVLQTLLKDNPDAANSSTVLLFIFVYVSFIFLIVIGSLAQATIFTATNSIIKSLNPITMAKVLWHSALNYFVYLLVSVLVVAPLILCIYILSICTLGLGFLLLPFVFVYLAFIQYYLLGFIYKNAALKTGLINDVKPATSSN